MKQNFQIIIFVVCVLFVVSMDFHAKDNLVTTFHDSDYPTPAQVLPQSRGDEPSTADGASQNYKTEITFINQEDHEIVTWGPSGAYEATILVDRYFGSDAERKKMVSLGIMDNTAKIYIPCYDCDSNPSSPTGEGVAPERDLVYLNGHYIGTLSGVNETAIMNTFEVPLEYLFFPKSPGAVAQNHLKILVDTANDHQVWYLGLLWQMLVIEAPPPVLLVHGWTNQQDTLAEFSSNLSNTLGIPSTLVDVSADNSPYANAVQLQADLERLTAQWGVEQFNIVAHSKGGLDSRVLIDQNGLNTDYVYQLLQVATPNLGSMFADVALAPVGRKQKAYSWTAEKFNNATQASPSFTSLTVENCIKFNQVYNTPNCPLHTLTGCVDRDDLSNEYKILSHFVELEGANDGMVTVDSAHALNTEISDSPLYERGTSKYDHSGIVREGAVDVIHAYEEILEEKPEPDYDFPPYKTVVFPTRSAGYVKEDAPSPNSPSASMETDVFSLEKGAVFQSEFHIFPGGEVNVGLLPCAPGTRAQIVYPDEKTTATMVAEELPPNIAGDAEILSVTLMDAPAGLYRIRVDCTEATGDAVAKLVVKEEQSWFVLELHAEQSIPPSVHPLVTASCYYRGGVITGDEIAMTLRASKPYEQQKTPLEFVMHDDGLNGDVKAHDGLFSCVFAPQENGNWNLEAEVQAEFGGHVLTRYATACIDVTDVTGSISTPLTETTDFPIGAIRLPAFTFTTDVNVSHPGRYSLTAELATQDGTVVSNAGTQWVSEAPGRHLCQLAFRTDEIVARHEAGPWRVQKLRLFLIGDEGEYSLPILLAQSDYTQPTQYTEYSQVVKYDFSLRILGTGSERIDAGGASLSQELVVRMDVEVTGVPPKHLWGSLLVDPVVGSGNGVAEVELVRDADGYHLVAYLGASAIQSCETVNSFVLKGCRVKFMDEDGFFHEIEIPGCYTTQEYPCRLFQQPKKLRTIKPGDWLQINLNATPDEDGFYKAHIQFTEPTDTQLTPDDDGASVLQPKTYYICLPGPSLDAFHLENGFYVNTSTTRGEYANVTEGAWRQLREEGDQDGVLDAGEILDFTIRYQRGDAWNDGYEISSMLELAEFACVSHDNETSYDFVYHSFDGNFDGSISKVELDAGKMTWRGEAVHSQTLLEAIELSLGEEYFYDEITGRFYPCL